MENDLQFAMDDLSRWCYRHRINNGKRMHIPDFNIKWGYRSGYTVTIRIKPRTFFYRGMEILRTSKMSVIDALKMAQIAAETAIYSTKG